MKDRRKFPAFVLLLGLGLLGSATGSSAAPTEFTALLDTDLNSGTGCTVPTADGPFPGIEARVVTEIDNTAEPPVVLQVLLESCVDPNTNSFGAPQVVATGPWPVAIGQGAGGSDSVETLIPSQLLSFRPILRTGFTTRYTLTDPQAQDALIGSPGRPIILIPAAGSPGQPSGIPGSTEPVPALAPLGLALLGLGLAIAGIRRYGRRGGGHLLLVVLVGSGVGVLWAAGADGTLDEWFGVPPIAQDAVGDSAPEADIQRVYFQRRNGQYLLRVDITQVQPENFPPTLDPIGDVELLEDAGLQNTNLTGISAGGAETQPLEVTATSDNTALIPHPTVSYTSDNPTGSLSYTPATDASGSALITVTVTDGGLDGMLATSGDNASFSRQFTVNVTGVNDPPVLTLPGPQAEYDGVDPVLIDPTATVTDIDSADFDTGVLQADVTEASCEAADQLSVNNEGEGAGQISVAGNSISYDTPAVLIGTISSAFQCSGPHSPLVIDLTANATPAAVQALARNLAFATSGATQPTRDVEISVSDGDGGTSDTASQSVVTDPAPTVDTVSPANAATGVAVAANVVIDFSEAVSATASAFSLECPGGSAIAFTPAPALPAINITSVTLDPDSDLPFGVTCTLTVDKDEITDQDAIDPPDNMKADFTSTFTTVDAAPRVTSTTPSAAGKAASNQVVTLNFSESVDIAAGAIAWDCGGAVAFTPALPQSNVSSLDLTPSGDLTEGAACTVTLESTLITDTDGIDPPDQLDGNSDLDTNDGDADDFTLNFDVDEAPTFTGSTPANNATNVLIGSNITLGFSEAVDVTTASFTLNCGAGNLAYVLSGSGTNSITLNPNADLPGGASCTVSITGANVSDSDGFDPPDTLASDPSFGFATQSIANDDAYNVTPHLTLGIDTGFQNGRVTQNDQLSPGGSITGFGFSPSCSTTLTGNQHDAGATNGRLTLNANGSFSYEPPAGVANTTKTFCYTVNGGDTADIVFTLQNTELVWFVDAAAAAGGTGNQAQPFQTVTAAAAADSTGDTIFVKHHASGYTCGVTLENGERLIGEGSGGTLTALSGVTPVSGSALPALTNMSTNWPTLTAATHCVTTGSNNTVRGFSFGNVGSANTALTGTNFGSLTVNDAMINTNGRALNLDTGTPSATFSSVSSNGSSAEGVRLNAVGGTVTINAGSIQASTTTAFLIAGGAGGVTYAGTINSDTGTLVNVNGTTGGTKTFSGSITDGNDGDGSGISLVNNTGATINFSGALTLSTGANPAFSATGGGTLSATGSPSTITTTTGTALNIANTTIGASGVTFRSISSNGAANGIVLNGTGSTGSFLVSGDGSMTAGVLDRDGSGGAIQNTSGSGISLTNANNVTIRQTNLVNNGGRAVQGTGGSNHVFSAVTIQNPTNHGWEATDLQGTNRIDNGSLVTQFNGINQDGVRLVNTNVNFTSFTVDNVTFSSSSTGNDGFFHRALGTTAGSIVVTGSMFTGLDGDGVQVANDGSGTIMTTVQGNTFTTADNTSGDGNNGLALNLGGTGIHQFLVGGPNVGEPNSFTDVNRLGDNSGVINVTAAGAGTAATSQVNGTIQGNSISNSTGRRGISALFEASGGTGHGGHTLVIDDNDINNVAREGIYVGMSSVAGRSNTGNKITITDNNVGDVSVVSTAGNREGIEIEAFHDGTGGGSIEADVLVENNVAVINNTDETFRVTNDAFTSGSAVTTTLDVTVLGNTFTNNNASGDSFEHRNWDAGSTSCLDLNAANSAGNRNNSNRGYLIARSGGTFGIEGLAAGPQSDATVNTFVDARNDGGASAASGGNFTGGVTCTLP